MKSEKVINILRKLVNEGNSAAENQKIIRDHWKYITPAVIVELILKFDYYDRCCDVLEEEKGEYYQAFDKFVEELGVFKETDPGNPKKSFETLSRIFRELKEKGK